MNGPVMASACGGFGPGFDFDGAINAHRDVLEPAAADGCATLAAGAGL